MYRGLWFVLNLPAVAWSACVSMMKMVIEVVKMGGTIYEHFDGKVFLATGWRGWAITWSSASWEFCWKSFALHELNHLYKEKLSRRELLAFHSRYKLQLLAHSQAGYKDMGPFVAAIHEWADLESYFEVYRDKLMAILRKPASRKNHTNVLMHIQGILVTT